MILVRHHLGSILEAFALGLTMCCLVVLIVVVSTQDRFAVARTGAPAVSQAQATQIAGLVYVVDDLCYDGPGCDAVSVADVSGPKALIEHHGQHLYCSPGRIAGSADLSVVVAAPANDTNRVSITRRSVDGSGRLKWRATAVSPQHDEDMFALRSGVSVTRDGTAMLLVLSRSGQWSDWISWPPFAIEKYLVADVADGRLGTPMGSFEVDSVPLEIVLTEDNRLAHVVVEKGVIHTLSLATMSELVPPVVVGPLTPATYTGVGQVRATLAPDGSHLVVTVNHGTPRVISVNLEERYSTELVLPTDLSLEIPRGIAFNYAAQNHGLLAIHRLDHIELYELTSAPSLVRVGAASTTPPRPSDLALETMHGAIAWTTDGAQVVAGADSVEGFRVFRVADGGRSIQPVSSFSPCQPHGLPGGVVPSDVLTANGYLPRPPTPTLVPTSTETSTAAPPPPSPTSTERASQTPTRFAPTPSATSSATPTAVPAPIHLPVALGERCTPDKQHIDAALVIDCSSSMEQQTGAGRTKIAAAIDAAGIFVDQLQLDAGDQAAVIAFNSEAWLLQELTNNRAALDRTLASIQTAMHTCLVCGVDVAADELASNRRNKDNTPVMIVLTDGLSNPRPVSEAVTRAAETKEDGVVVYTIGLGDSLDFEALTQMASKPEYFYRAPDAEDLAGIYQQIAVEIPCPMDEFWGRR
jgi:uncharacterized protein YegL